MIVAEQDVPLMLQYARWYLIHTEDYLAKLPPDCRCEKHRKELGPTSGECGRCHTGIQLGRAQRFLADYGGDR